MAKQERQRLGAQHSKPPRKTGEISVKDWVSMILSILAFTISALSAYFSVIQRSDDISLVFRSPLAISRGENDAVLLEKEAMYPLVLINSGNRAVVISKIALMLFQFKEKPTTDCRNSLGMPLEFDTDFTETVLKEREVSAKTIKLMPSADMPAEVWSATSDSFKVPMQGGLEPLDEYVLQACLEVQLSTPSLAYQTSLIEVSTVGSAQGGLYQGDRAKWYPRPRVVLKKWGTVFNY